VSSLYAIIISHKGQYLKINATTPNLSFDGFNKKLIGVLSILILLGLILLFMKEDPGGKTYSGYRNL
jgi:hypothetical protein